MITACALPVVGAGVVGAGVGVVCVGVVGLVLSTTAGLLSATDDCCTGALGVVCWVLLSTTGVEGVVDETVADSA